MLQGILGLIVFVLIAFVLSENKRRVPLGKIIVGITSQIVLAISFMKIPFLQTFFLFLNQGVSMIERATGDGARYMFGYLAGPPLPFKEEVGSSHFIIAFQVLPIVLVMSALSSVLFHFGIIQFIIKILSRLLQKSMKISGVQALGVAANIFLGIVEAPLLIRPYISTMSRNSLFTVMTAGMATVAGTVMVLYATLVNPIIPNAIGHILLASLISAPAAIVMAHIMVPETEDIAVESVIMIERKTSTGMDALVQGTMDGMQLVLSVVAMIVVLFSVISLINQFLSFLPDIGGHPITLEFLFGLLFRPLMWLMGIPWKETEVASQLMATKTVFNEFVSYRKMVDLPPDSLSERSRLILLYAMCGFANFASLGLLVSSMGSFAPERRQEVISLGFRSLVSGTLATLMTGAIIGIVS